MRVDERGRLAGQRTVTMFHASTDVAAEYDELLHRRRSQRRNRAAALAASAVVAVLAILSVQANLAADPQPQPLKPLPGIDIGDVPVWYDDAGLHYGDFEDQTAVPLTLRGDGAALSLVRTGALYQDPKLREIWFHPWGGEPRVIGKDPGEPYYRPAYGPAGDPEGDTAAWFEGLELVVYDTALAQEIARVETGRVTGKRAPEHFQTGNGFMQVSSDAVVWSSVSGALVRLDLQTMEITQTGWNWGARVEDVHDQTELWSWGGNSLRRGGLRIRTPSSEVLEFPEFEEKYGRLSPDGRFLLAVSAKPHGTTFVEIESGESFTLPDQDEEFYPWISWSYGNTAVIIVDDKGKDSFKTLFEGTVLACDAERRACERLPTAGKVILPTT